MTEAEEMAEVERREKEIETGQVRPLSGVEFWCGVEADRNQSAAQPSVAVQPRRPARAHAKEPSPPHRSASHTDLCRHLSRSNSAITSHPASVRQRYPAPQQTAPSAFRF